MSHSIAFKIMGGVVVIGREMERGKEQCGTSASSHGSLEIRPRTISAVMYMKACSMTSPTLRSQVSCALSFEI